MHGHQITMSAPNQNVSTHGHRLVDKLLISSGIPRRFWIREPLLPFSLPFGAFDRPKSARTTSKYMKNTKSWKRKENTWIEDLKANNLFSCFLFLLKFSTRWKNSHEMLSLDHNLRAVQYRPGRARPGVRVRKSKKRKRKLFELKLWKQNPPEPP